MSSPAAVWAEVRGTAAQTAKHNKETDRTKSDKLVFIIPRIDRRRSVRSKPLLGALAKPRSTSRSRGSNRGCYHRSDRRRRQTIGIAFFELTLRDLGRMT